MLGLWEEVIRYNLMVPSPKTWICKEGLCDLKKVRCCSFWAHNHVQPRKSRQEDRGGWRPGRSRSLAFFEPGLGEHVGMANKKS